MQNNTNKESFKLLQLSDTSKSSELELPEVNTQRKRRIRRKVRTSASPHLRSYNSSHKDSTDDMNAPCQNVGLWIAVFMSCGWLLILSYMMAVVYTENRRLEVEISKLSTSSQNVPEALQKWHETSKMLEQNQTSLSSILNAMQKRVDEFEKELNIVKDAISKKDANSEQNKVSILENTVSTFGAKMMDLTVNVDDLKEKMKDIKAKEDVTQTSLNKLQETFNNTKITSVSVNNDDTKIAITNMTTYFTKEIKSLSTDLSTVNNTLTQKTNGLEVEVNKSIKVPLDALTEKVANITSKVESIDFTLDQLKTNQANVSTLPATTASNGNRGALNSN